MVHHNYHNGLKTTLLLGGIWALLFAISTMIAVGTGYAVWLFVFVGIGLVRMTYSYWSSVAIALRSMGAHRVGEVQYPQLYAIVRRLVARAQQPMPSIWVTPSLTPDAFATGRNPNNTTVCRTESILAILNKRELRGVLGHELVHVYNRDILTTSVAAAMGGVITSVVQFFMFFGGRNGRDGSGGMEFVGTLVLSLLAPFTSMLIQFSLSHTREFDADGDGTMLTQDLLILASALRKLEIATDWRPMEDTPHTRNVAAMMITNPFRRQSVMRLFPTHPPMEQRIARLERVTGY